MIIHSCFEITSFQLLVLFFLFCFAFGHLVRRQVPGLANLLVFVISDHVLMMTTKPDHSHSMGNKIVKGLKSNLLIILMIIAVIIGLGLGFGMRGVWTPYETRKIFYLRFPGDLLMNMLKMLILPLIVSSLITAMGSLDTNASGRMGLRTVVYYMTTTFSAVILGIILVVTIEPGHKGSKNITKAGSPKEAEPLDALFDLIRYGRLVVVFVGKILCRYSKYFVKLQEAF